MIRFPFRKNVRLLPDDKLSDSNSGDFLRKFSSLSSKIHSGFTAAALFILGPSVIGLSAQVLPKLRCLSLIQTNLRMWQLLFRYFY